MNFKMKAAVAALALTASMSASAAMTNTASGDSSLILTLLDNGNNISAVFDLGYNYSGFQAGVVDAKGMNISWNLAGNSDYASAWSSFLGTASLANSRWAVFAGDNTGSGVGSRGLVSTYAAGAAYATLSDLTGALSGMGNYIGANDLIGNHSSVLNGSSSAISGPAFAETSTVYGTTGKLAGKGTLVTWGAFDSSLSVISDKANSGAVGTTLVAYANDAKFTMTSNGQLVYSTAPIPEADTWAMLLAGLGLMGFIARRRTAA